MQSAVTFFFSLGTIMNRCRLCAAKIPNRPQAVNNENSEFSYVTTVNIDDMLKIFQNFPVPSSRLPNIACTSCVKDLQFCYKFYAKVLQSTKSLLELYKTQTERYRKIAPKPENIPRPIGCINGIARQNRRYVCEECSSSFKSYRQLVSHHAIHEPTNACHYCGIVYFDKHNLQSHIRIEHEELKFKCNECNLNLTSRNLLIKHLRKCHNGAQRTYRCSGCPATNEIFTGKDSIEKHVEVTHPNVQTETEDVEAKTPKEDEIEPDMIEEFLDYMDEEFLDDFLLNQDQGSFCWDELSLTHLDDDLRTPSPSTEPLKEGRYRCPQCNEHFSAQKTLIQHLAHVHGEYVLYCNTCGMAFNRHSKLREHCISHVKENKSEPDHGRKISSKKGISRHCSTCNKTYKTAAGLKYHLRTHSKAKPFTCPYCRRTFVASINLNAHIRNVHADIKPNLCTLCDRKFASLDHLKKHVSSVHQKERNHLCSVCGKSFSQASHLSQHSLIHTGVKPFKCNTCGLGFHKKIEVIKHKEKNHPAAIDT